MDKKIIRRRLKDIELLDFQCTDIGAGDIFVEVFKEFVKYVPTLKKYYLWDGCKGIWQADDQEQINELVKALVSIYLPKLLDKIEEGEQFDMYRKWFKYLQSNAGMGNMLKAARSRPDITIKMEEFDMNARYFNVKNGVIDLKTREFLPHDKKYMQTKQANVFFNPKVKDETWDKFLLSIMDGDEERCIYLLRMLAYAMMGEPKHDVMFILFGSSTRNGKSTFANSALNFFGDYGTTTQPETIAKQKYRRSGNASPELVKLKGKRFINIAEPPNNYDLDAAMIKALTGGDVISARPLYGDYYDFINQGVFYLNSNHLPNVDDPTLFMSSRVIVIPFEVQFTSEEADVDMVEKLACENATSSLLNNIMETMEKYNDIGIKEDTPKKVKQATKKYAETADHFQCFINENIVIEKTTWTPTSRIVMRYLQWAYKYNRPSLSSKAITEELVKRGFDGSRKNKGVGFRGIKLKPMVK